MGIGMVPPRIEARAGGRHNGREAEKNQQKAQAVGGQYLVGKQVTPIARSREHLVYAFYGTWGLLDGCKYSPMECGNDLLIVLRHVFLLILVPCPIVWELAAHDSAG